MTILGIHICMDEVRQGFMLVASLGGFVGVVRAWLGRS